MGRFQELLRAANNLRLLAAVGRSGGELSSIGDLVDSFENSPQLAESVRRFRAVPGGADLLEQRYPPLEPDIERLRQLPPGSLGNRYAELILSLGYDPEFFRPRDTSDPGRWLTQRIANTHDLHHVISGFGTAPEGENGVLTITATQIGFPGMCCSPRRASWRTSASAGALRADQPGRGPRSGDRPPGALPGGGALGGGLGEARAPVAPGAGPHGPRRWGVLRPRRPAGGAAVRRLADGLTLGRAVLGLP